ncbi:hypothetical protein AB4274_13470 [Vibrio sp. 10N.261.55.A10]|uniref:hypothetical protein n=1 Tax=Vibrio sp. 10N.261.55.A10 TaxID=3229687 RepID=UPI0035503B7C
MKSLVKASTLTLIALSTISGCVTIPSSQTERGLEYAAPFQSFNYTKKGETITHSEAMQVMSLYSRQSPTRYNNLDDFSNKNHNVFLSATQVGVAAGTFTSAFNPFQATTRLIGLQATKSSMTKKYKKNVLISIVPKNDMSLLELESAVHKAHTAQLQVASNAYKDAGFNPVTLVDGKDINWNRIYPLTYVAPLNNDKTALCASQYDYQSMKDKAGATSGHEESKDCYAYTSYWAQYYYGADNNNSYSEVVPKKGDFIVVHTVLPDVFPVSKIKSDEEGMYLYQPSFYWLNSYNLSQMAKNQMNVLMDYANKGEFSEVPRVLKLNARTELMFGTN